LCDHRIYAIINVVAEIEAHDEVVEWLDELSQNEWERASVVIDRLASLGSQARMPFSRSLGEGLFEVRFTVGSTARRITYRFTKNSRIILLTTFRKQRNNERAEITRARKIAQDCAKRNP
jgi:putative component of toxin-antitoxin plasmid stabilization module